jgi:hypothetical protein
MLARDYRDLLGGSLLFAVGTAVGLHAVATFDVGDINRLGPGTFPAGLGFLLSMLGAAIAVPAWFRRGTLPEIHWRPAVCVSLGVLGFALIVPSFGMVPAIAALTVGALLADGPLGPRSTAVLTLALSALAYLVFRLGLGIALEPFRWPL